MITNHVSLTRNSGLKPSKMRSYRFEVRAENAEVAGEWKIFSAYIGRFMYCIAGKFGLCIFTLAS